MRRRAAPRWPASMRAAMLRVGAASLATALVAALGITSAVALGSYPAAPDATKAQVAAAPATLPGTVGAVPLSGPGPHVRGGAPGGNLLAAAEQGDVDDRGLAPAGADMPHRVPAVEPTAPGARPAAGAPHPPSGLTSTVRGRAPPA
ncbi:MAG: hypothetical protein ACODAF_01925 [Actinomycetota bacterium]